MRLNINHQTRYTYDAPVAYGLQQIRLTPKSCATQNIVSWETEITGGEVEAEFEDQYDNHVILVRTHENETEIGIHASGKADTMDTNGIIGKHTGFVPLWCFKRSTPLTEVGKNIRSLVRELSRDFDSDLEMMHELTRLIGQHVAYEVGTTASTTTAEEALEHGRGVCQDHAHIMIGAARHLGMPARYVSGYLMMNDRIVQDASHAWVEVHCDGIGWTGFDVSNGISPDERYVRIATGLDYREAAPVFGIRHGNAGESMNVTVNVEQ